MSITPGSSLWLRILGCPTFSVASFEIFMATASRAWNLREQNEDTCLWPEEYDKVVLRSNLAEGITTESRWRSVEQLFDTLELVALAVEDSHLGATEDPFEPTARCINDTKKRQLVTKSGVQRRCCVCNLHHEQEMKAPAAVRQFFKTVPQQVCHCKVDFIAADANAAAYKYYQCQECQDLYFPRG